MSLVEETLDWSELMQRRVSVRRTKAHKQDWNNLLLLASHNNQNGLAFVCGRQSAKSKVIMVNSSHYYTNTISAFHSSIEKREIRMPPIIQYRHKQTIDFIWSHPNRIRQRRVYFFLQIGGNRFNIEKESWWAWEWEAGMKWAFPILSITGR